MAFEIDDTNKFGFDIAYMVYSTVYDQWKSLTQPQKNKARRQVEATVNEAGFRGHSTKLISEAAWQTVLNEKRGIEPSKGDRVATEHPITFTNVALFILNLEDKLSYDDYFAVWFNNLITTTTTNAENYRLKDYQKNFKFGIDCWKQMYENAGIKLMERPRVMSHDEKREWGLM
jgi:hypothetical protein